MNEVLRRRLMQTALAISVAGGAGTGAYVYNQDTAEVLLAHEMGAYLKVAVSTLVLHTWIRMVPVSRGRYVTALQAPMLFPANTTVKLSAKT